MPSAPGNITECSTAPDQPTVYDAGAPAVPVSCMDITLHPVTMSTTGALPATSFTVATGVVGPPGTGTDSDGGDAATDAAAYPCPPTPAQQSAGITCAVMVTDHPTDAVVVPISFRS